MVFTKFTQALTLLAAAVAITSTAALSRVHPAVHRALRQQGTVNLIVTLKDGTTEPLKLVQEASYDSRGAKIEAIVEKLQGHAATSQVEMNMVLAQESTSATPLFSRVESFWISNQVYFQDASFELVERLASLSSVSAIEEEAMVPFHSGAAEAADATNVTTNATATEWGVAIVKAPEAWAKGFTGQGIVVGGIDTGVRATHEVLRGNFRAAYGWFDGDTGKLEPFDDDGHGTHTLGSAVGALGVGVAPGASWIGCRGCNTNWCTQSALLACGQFMTCPTDPSGANKDCSKAPHVVNNSWGGGGYDDYASIINAWTAAGIIPVFSAGNSGFGGCSTVDSPGDRPDVIDVGATTITDGLGGLSSKGPSAKGLIKPDLTAPGINVRSATYTSDTAYKSDQGTSMASPHVAGVIALMLSANKNLTFDEVLSILTSTADSATLQPSKYTCGGTTDAMVPNNQYGYGRVNALNAVLKAGATSAAK